MNEAATFGAGSPLQIERCFHGGRINIRSRTGEPKGWMKKNLLLPNRINVYDKYGNMRGYWVRDTLNPDTWFFKKSW